MVEFDFAGWRQIVSHVNGITDPDEIRAYVDAKFAKAVEFLNSLTPDACLTGDMELTVFEPAPYWDRFKVAPDLLKIAPPGFDEEIARVQRAWSEFEGKIEALRKSLLGRF
jgi:hypothetical protein